jgi:hypothetical protein
VVTYAVGASAALPFALIGGNILRRFAAPRPPVAHLGRNPIRGAAHAIVGFGLYFALAIFCAVHAVRTGQPLYWLMVLFAFPILGAVVYIVAIYLPVRGCGGTRPRRSTPPPGRWIRSGGTRARAAFEETPSRAQPDAPGLRVVGRGRCARCGAGLRGLPVGPFAKDPEIRLGAARAHVECQRYADALRMLQALRSEHPEFRPEPVALLTARALAGTSRRRKPARSSPMPRRASEPTRRRRKYAIWAYAIGDPLTSARLQADLDTIAARWNVLARELNAPRRRRVLRARELAGGKSGRG